MQIAIVHNSVVTAVGDYRSLFAQTSFPTTGPDASFLEENNAKQVNAFRQHDRNTQKLVNVPAYLDADGAVYTVTVEPLTADDLAQRTASKAAEVRADRNARLTACDWTQLGDFPKANQGAWKQYRQALRDLPAQAGFPEAVNWPTEPGGA